MHKSLKPKYVIKNSTPSSRGWEGALPLGDSKTGALCLCTARNDKIMLTSREGVYGGSVGVLPDISDKLKEARRLTLVNNQMLAGITLETALENKKYKPTVDMLLPIADLEFEHTNAGKISAYSKNLAMDNEEVSVCYTANGTKVDRSAFVSFKDGLFYLEISKSGAGVLDFEFSLGCHDKSKDVFNGKFASLPDSEVKAVSNNFLVYEGCYGGKAYGAVMRVLVDNKAMLLTTSDKLRVQGAEKIVVVLKTYVGKVKEKLLEKTRSELANLKQISYEKAFKEHIEVYQKLFGKAELSLGARKSEDISEFLEKQSEASKLCLAEKLFHYGKYLLLTGVDDKFSLPFSSGLWEVYKANDKSMLDLSCGVPSLYSAALNFGQLDKVEGVINYIKSYLDDLKKNANRIYKSSGFMVPNSFVIGSMLPSRVDASNISTITAGASIARMFYDYFLYTKDIKFLSSTALPFMTSVADFYMNYFYLNECGKYESVPSFSPMGKSKFYESREEKVQRNSTCDFVMAKDVLKNIIEVSNIYSLPVAKLIEYQKFYNELCKQFPLKDGELLEFRGDENSSFSSGVMHLFDTFGAKSVNLTSEQTVQNVMLTTLKAKLSAGLYNQNVLALSYLLKMCVVLGKSDLFDGILGFMLENYLSENLLFLKEDKYYLCKRECDNNYFNLPVNMQVASAITSAFVLDFDNNIVILPSKISAWEQGEISGIYTRVNVLVDVTFDDKRGSAQVNLKALKNTTFNLILFKGAKKVKGYNIDSVNPRIDNIKLSAGKSIAFDIKY